jgi:site-specific recombinase XerD
MELAPVHDEFCAYLDLECARSPQTLASYASDFRQFLSFLAETNRRPEVEEVDRQAVRAYVTWLRRRHLSVPTVSRHLASLRSFWKYVRDGGYTEHDPFVRVSVPKRGKALPVCLSAAEAQALLDAAGDQPNPLKAVRDTAVLSVLVFTGLRRNELLGLRLPAVDLAEGTLRVEHGKGDKARMVPLTLRPRVALADWLEVRPETDHDYLFTSSDARPLARKGLMGLFRRAVRRAGIARPGLVLHSLRHTAATLLLQGGCDLRSLQRLLGHSRLDTTATYLSLTMSDLHRAVARHPLAGAVEETDSLPLAVGVGVQVSAGGLQRLVPHQVPDGGRIDAEAAEVRGEPMPHRMQREASAGEARALA